MLKRRSDRRQQVRDQDTRRRPAGAFSEASERPAVQSKIGERVPLWASRPDGRNESARGAVCQPGSTCKRCSAGSKARSADVLGRVSLPGSRGDWLQGSDLRSAEERPVMAHITSPGAPARRSVRVFTAGPSGMEGTPEGPRPPCHTHGKGTDRRTARGGGWGRARGRRFQRASPRRVAEQQRGGGTR